MTLTISAIASILVIGALIASPDAYSSKNSDVLDECACQKPHTLTVLFEAPDDAPDDATYRVEIFKKLDDRDNEEKQLGPHISVVDNGNITIFASNFGKDKLESNTAFVIYEVDGEYDDVNEVYSDKLVSLMEIHTSCSKPLFIDMVVDDSETTDNGFKLTVKDGLSGNNPPMTSIPIGEPLTCEDKKQKSTGTITVRKAITNDNGGTKEAKDFVITLNDVETGNIIETLVQEDLDVPIFTATVPAGTYKLSETGTEGYDIVLIAGDTYCPSMVDEPFTIKKNKNLSCTIYNDDNGDGTSGGNGFFFVRNSISFEPQSAGTCEFDKDTEGILTINNSPCLVNNGGALFIADPTLDDPTEAPFAIITSTIIQITTEALSPPQCVFLGVSEMFGVVGFGLDCDGFQIGSTYNANYAIIDASPQG